MQPDVEVQKGINNVNAGESDYQRNLMSTHVIRTKGKRKAAAGEA